MPFATPSTALSYAPLPNFDDITARPPTPPRGSRAIGTKAAPPKATTSPTNSPSSTDSSQQTNGKVRKRVGFSPLRTSYHRLPAYSGDSIGTPLRPLPPSRERKSVKSILKPSDQTVPLLPTDFSRPTGQGIQAHSYGSFANMLQSVVQQLAGTVRSNKLDAYIAISGTLKAYQDGSPDLEAMTGQMGLFMQFIQRDMSATMESGSLDSPLITKALKLLIIFFWSPQLSASLTDEFRSFVLDHSIAAVEDPQMPKALTNHYVHLLGQQRFSSKIMTPQRADRLFTVLHKDHIKGNGVTGERLVVYQRLLSQAQQVMILRSAEWMQHLFSSLLSTIKEIRSRAIVFGMEAGIKLGDVRDVSRAISTLFNRKVEGGIFAELLEKRLRKMIADKEDGPHAAQIWSVVVLFFRSHPHQLEHWEHIQLWLRIIEECFNSSDMMIRYHANLAWNKLIYSIKLNADTGESTIKMLRIPITIPLEKKGNDKLSVKGRQMALATLCNLLYYSLAPLTKDKQRDQYWDIYIGEVLGKVFQSDCGDANQACEILAALFDGRQEKKWNIHRAAQNGPVTPEELPRLDSKWVRSRTGKILRSIEVALRKATWNDDMEEEAPIQRLWLNFTKTVSDAGSLEVKISNDLIEAIAHMFNMLQRIWKGGPSSLNVRNRHPQDTFVRRFGFLVQSAIANIGAICFTEKVLSINSQDHFEAVSTPSHRSSSSSRGLASPLSPVLHLFHLYLSPPHGVVLSPSYYIAIKDTLEACNNSRGSRRTRLDLLRQCIQALPLTLAPSMEPVHFSAVWQLLAGLTENAMFMAPQEKALYSPQPVGHEYKDMKAVLEWGCKNCQGCHFEMWRHLFLKFTDTVKQELGLAGVALAAIEPLAAELLEERIDIRGGVILTYGSVILERTVYPKNRQAIDIAHKALWGNIVGPRKASSFDPFDHVYQMTNHFLMASYKQFLSIDGNSVRTFLAEVTTLVDRCPLALLSILLKRIQEGVSLWVEDGENKLGGKDPAVWEVFMAVTQLWTRICSAIERLPGHDSFLLKTLSIIVSSGLESRRKIVANATVELWNSTFGAQEVLDYPTKVKSALQRLRPVVDLQLPTFPDSNEDEIAATPPEFSESQEEEDYHGRDHIQFSSPTPIPTTPGAFSKDRLTLRVRGTSFSPMSSPSQLYTPERTPGIEVVRTTPRPRLRHDDSQIQFAPIDSSPIGGSELNSQVLTEHQKDVRERQHTEAAAMFPDIRSSPKLQGSKVKGSFRQFTLSSDLPSTGDLAIDGPSTPTLPPPSRDRLHDSIGSSPTPRSELRNAAVEDYTPPSSPPIPEEDFEPIHVADSPSLRQSIEDREDVTDSGLTPFYTPAQEGYGQPETALVEPEAILSGEEHTEGQMQLQAWEAEADMLESMEAEIPKQGSLQDDEKAEPILSVHGDLQNTHPITLDEDMGVPKTPPRRQESMDNEQPVSSMNLSGPHTGSYISNASIQASPIQAQLRREHAIEVPRTAEPTRKSAMLVTPITQNLSVTFAKEDEITRIGDSHAKENSQELTVADVEESSAGGFNLLAEQENSDLLDTSPDLSAPTPAARGKRKRSSLFSPRKAKKSKQQAKVEDEEIGDCIIVECTPQKMPTFLQMTNKRILAAKGHTAVESPALPIESDSVLPRTRKRRLSESTVPDNVDQSPTVTTKRARRAKWNASISSAVKRRSSRLSQISIPSPEKVDYSDEDTEDISRAPTGGSARNVRDATPPPLPSVARPKTEGFRYHG